MLLDFMIIGLMFYDNLWWVYLLLYLWWVIVGWFGGLFIFVIVLVILVLMNFGGFEVCVVFENCN